MQFLNWRKQGFSDYDVLLSSQIWRTMRMIVILLTAAFLQVSAKGLSQKITLSFKAVPLERVFDAIKKQSDYHFFYNAKQLKEASPVSINVRDASIDEVLNVCLKGQPFTYTIVGNLVTLNKKTQSPILVPELQEKEANINVKGRVVNQNNEAVVGATVLVRGTVYPSLVFFLNK